MSRAKTQTGPLLALRGVHRTYQAGRGPLHVLRGVDLDIWPGEMVGLVGPSGSGKSSLLHAAGLLEHPNSGEVWLQGKECSRLSERARTKVRLRAIGFVYQFHHLLPEFDARENVALPVMIAGANARQADDRAQDLLTQMGLAERMDHRPAELSGGEQQRVAIARALANRPGLLLADEPTGNLDPDTASGVFQSLQALVRRQGVSALIATHNLQLAAYMDRVFALKDGHLTPWTPAPQP